MCSDFAEHGSPKVPCGNFLPLKVKNPRYTPPDLLSFNIFKVRGLRAGICKANSIKRKGTPTACLFRAQRARSPAAFCLRQNRQDRRSAERRVKILQESRGVYLTFLPLPAPPRRGLVRCADVRGLSPPVSSEPGAYLRGPASPLERSSAAQLRQIPVNARLRAVQHLGHLAYCALQTEIAVLFQL